MRKRGHLPWSSRTMASLLTKPRNTQATFFSILQAFLAEPAPSASSTLCIFHRVELSRCVPAGVVLVRVSLLVKHPWNFVQCSITMLVHIERPSFSRTCLAPATLIEPFGSSDTSN
eukprot:TRINITY_DN19034_c0_g1_i1.p2 TRINITY_DN19034_c0_g1~~TRINITY_DN19034_c0_g1_i1.p2  ORF type:complete len:116 (+),score=18.39 TRINITY_DN19034_c0_g1_i1:81-428(+)